jgi:ADP-dependent phosphofructokinase/glucokinase
MDTRPPETLAYKNFTDAFPEPQTKPSLDIVLDYKGGFPATPEKQTVKFIFKFETQLNTSLTDEEINAQMRYIKEIVDDEEVMLEIAYNALQKVIAPGYSSLAEQKNKKSLTREEAKQKLNKLREWLHKKQGVKK